MSQLVKLAVWDFILMQIAGNVKDANIAGNGYDLLI